MNIKFKYLNLYYVFVSAISPLCILILIFEPDFGAFSNEIQNACLLMVVLFGISGVFLAILEKAGIVKITYSEEDRTRLFYKLLNIDKHFFE